jgi:polygalacturonase
MHPNFRRAVRGAVALVLTAAMVPAAAAGAQAAAPTGDPADSSAGWREADAIRDRVQPPQFADLEVDITDFGADPTGVAKSTDAISAAIEAVSEAGGGRVVVPDGVFLTGAIHFRSDVELHLADDATLRFSRDKADFLPVVKTRYEGVELYNYSPFIYGFQVENVALTGNGTLDGQADAQNWWDWKTARVEGPCDGRCPVIEQEDRQELFRMGEEGVPVEERVFGEGHFIRPNFVQFYESRNILVQDVTLNNSPMWLVHPVLSENVTVDGVHLESLGPNNDGVNPESSRDVVIKNTFFNTGDDCIAIKSGRNAEGRRIGVPSENILIEDNFMQAGHGAVVAGSEMSGGVRNVFAQDNVMDSPDLDRALRIKTNSVRGGVVEDIYFRDNQVLETGGQAVWIDFRYEEGDAGDFTPTVRDIYIENVHSRGGTHALFLRGYERSPITNVNISGSSFTDVDTPMLVENVQGLRLTDVQINGQPADTVVCQGTVWFGVPEVLVDSGVADREVRDRRCLSEQFAEDDDWRSPGWFRGQAVRTATQLWRDGLVSTPERDALKAAAKATDIGAR